MRAVEYRSYQHPAIAHYHSRHSSSVALIVVDFWGGDWGEAGATVTLLEKEKSIGGNSAKATSGINGISTTPQVFRAGSPHAHGCLRISSLV